MESFGIVNSAGILQPGELAHVAPPSQPELHYVNSFTQIKISVQNLPQKRVNRD